MHMFNRNSQISAMGGTGALSIPVTNYSAFNLPGLNSFAYNNLLSGTSGLTGMNWGAGTDQINLGSEASGMLGTSNAAGLANSLGVGDSSTGFIMQMINKLTASSNTLASQLLSGSSTASTSSSGTASDSVSAATSSSGTASGSAAASTGSTSTGGLKLTGGKLDTTGVQNSQRQASGSNEVGGGQIITSGTVNNTMGTTEITSDYVRADGKPSASGDGAYKTQAGPVFENRCPCCGKKGVLSYERSTKSNGCPEGMFFCDSKKGGCDADFSVISGKDHGGKNKHLTKVDATKAASGTASTGSVAAVGTAGSTAAVNSTGAASSSNTSTGSTASSNSDTSVKTGSGNTGMTPSGTPSNSNDPAWSIAKEFSKYSWSYYYDDKKSNAATESSKDGNCCDLAQLAIEKFKAKGVNARLILGQLNTSDYSGGHYWVQYQDPSTGQWKFFDPTPCATNKSAERGFLGCHGTYSSGKVVSNG